MKFICCSELYLVVRMSSCIFSLLLFMYGPVRCLFIQQYLNHICFGAAKKKEYNREDGALEELVPNTNKVYMQI
jgi:hypothetical protein